MALPIVEILNYEVFSGTLDEIPYTEPLILINTLNAYSYVAARNDRLFRNALKHSTMLVADGFPVVMAARFLKNKRIKKIAGADVFYFLLNYLNSNSLSCFFLGSSPASLEKIKARLSVEYPNIRAGFYSPPFKEQFTAEESKKMIEEIRCFSPEVLFVGMTAPKQEKWVSAHINDIQAHIITCIGAVFDFYAQTKPRPSDFWIRNNLEWFRRLVKEPRRLWKRYLVYSPMFLVDVVLSKLGLLKARD
jgi:N-acetylglucosaminyldiphosphoundecaprenol N-acetyl-beta-D-mannosaminyltransferase